MRRCRFRGAQEGTQGFCVSKVFPGTYFSKFRRGAARRSSWGVLLRGFGGGLCFSKENPSMIFLFLRIMPYNHAIFQRHDYALVGKMLVILKDYQGLSAASAPRTHLPSGDRPEAEEGAAISTRRGGGAHVSCSARHPRRWAAAPLASPARGQGAARASLPEGT